MAYGWQNTLAAALRCLAVSGLVVSLIGCSKDPAELLSLARQAHGKGDSMSAVVQLKQALQAAPENGEVRFFLGTVYNDTFDAVAAEKEVRKALEIGVVSGGKVAMELARALRMQYKFKELLAEVAPSPAYEPDAQATIIAWRGSSHFALGQLDLAKKSLAEAQALGRNIPAVSLLAAQVKVAEKDLAAAESLVDSAIEQFPNSFDVWSFKADLAKAQGNRDGALAAYNKMLGIYPRHLGALVGRSGVLLQQNKIAEAKADIDSMRKWHRLQPVIYQQLAMLQIAQKQFSEALETLQHLLKAAPDFAPGLLLSGVAHLALGSPAQAEVALSRYLSADPRNPTARRLLATALVRLNQSQRALETIDPVLRSDLRDAAVIEVASDALMGMGDLSKASTLLDQAVELSPDNKAQLLAKRADVDLRAGQFTQAIEHLEKAAGASDRAGRADVLLVLANLARNDLDKALQAVNELDKKAPNRAEVLHLKGSVVLRRGDTAEAITLFQKALAVRADFYPAAASLAMLDLAGGKNDEARKRYEAVLNADKNSLPAMMALADWYRDAGNTAESMKLLERAAATHKQAIAPRVRLADVAIARGEKQKATAIADDLLVSHPDHPAALELLGGLQAHAGELNRAIATFGRLVSLYPKSSGGYFALAQAHFRNGALKDAESNLKKALSITPNEMRYQRLLIEVMLKGKRVEEALRIARTIHAAQPKAPQGLVFEGEIYIAQKNYAQAASAFARALDVMPMGDIAVKLYSARASAGNPDAALDGLAKWVEKYPTNNLARFTLAGLLSVKEDYRGATGHYEKLHQSLPNDWSILNGLAWAYFNTGDARARDTAERAYKLAPNDPLVQDTFGWIVYMQGDPARGRELIEKAAKAAPDVPEIRYHLAAILAKAGNQAQAKQELAAAMRSGTRFSGKQEAEKLLKSLGG